MNAAHSSARLVAFPDKWFFGRSTRTAGPTKVGEYAGVGRLRMDQFRWVLDIIFAVAVCWYIELQVSKTKKWVEGLVA
jgi:hypothetical protein